MHVCMFFNHRDRVEPWPELVQSTDQAAHRAIGVAAALVTTWITCARAAAGGPRHPHPAGTRPCLRRHCPPRP